MVTQEVAAAVGPLSAYENLTNGEFIYRLGRALDVAEQIQMYAEIEED